MKYKCKAGSTSVVMVKNTKLKNAETAMKEIGEHLCICTKLTAPPPDCIWGKNITYSPFSSRQNLVNLLKVGA
jgi:hypothetical protein